MNLYAIHDRLIDHWMQPFVGNSDKEVMAAISQAINHPETTHAIAQAPHHYEIYKIGEVFEGHIKPCREFVADCSTLVRTSIRQGPDPRGTALQAATGANQDQAGRAPGNGKTQERATREPVAGEDDATVEVRGQFGRAHPGN